MKSTVGRIKGVQDKVGIELTDKLMMCIAKKEYVKAYEYIEAVFDKGHTEGFSKGQVEQWKAFRKHYLSGPEL